MSPDTRFVMQGDFSNLNQADIQGSSQHSGPSRDQDRLDGNSLNAPSGGAGQNQVQPDGAPQGSIPSAQLGPVVPPLQLPRQQQGPHISSGLTMQQWQATQAMQDLTEQALQQMQQPPQHSAGLLVRPWLREGSPDAPPGEQCLQQPRVPAVQDVQMERSAVPPELLPMYREAAYAMYCNLCQQRGQQPLPRDYHLPTPASVLVSNLHPYASQQQVFNVFSSFGRITDMEGPRVVNFLAPVPVPYGPFQHPPVMRPTAVAHYARIHYASRDDAIMAYSTFDTLDRRIHAMPPVAAISNGFLFVTLEVQCASFH